MARALLVSILLLSLTGCETFQVRDYPEEDILVERWGKLLPPPKDVARHADF